MRCKNCHYSLANLTGPPHRCPECGREFDPNDRATFVTDRSLRNTRIGHRIGLAFSGSAVALWTVVAFTRDNPWWLLTALVFVPFVVIHLRGLRRRVTT